jgi:hypothetical protein
MDSIKLRINQLKNLKKKCKSLEKNEKKRKKLN